MIFYNFFKCWYFKISARKILKLKITTVIFSSIFIEKTNSIQVAFYASLQSHKEENLIASSEFEAMYYDKINLLGQVA